MKFDNFFDAYHFVDNHPMFKGVSINNVPYMEVVKVSPKSNRIVNDDSKNTKVQIWLEYGPIQIYEGITQGVHDIDLDCGGDTYEEAMINLANLLLKKYGNINQYTTEGRKIKNAVFQLSILTKKGEKIPDLDFSKREWKKVIKKYSNKYDEYAKRKDSVYKLMNL